MSIGANAALRLLRVVGSPFVSEKTAPETDEISDFYNMSVKNKIELTYLRNLDELGRLGNLNSIYSQKKKDYQTLLKTLTRFSEVLNEEDIYAVPFKTLFPFEEVPNDIDVIVLSRNVKCDNILDVAIRKGFTIFDRIPHCMSFHDLRDTPHIDPNKKDPYDIDLYDEISANHIIYFNKSKLEANTRYIEVHGKHVLVFSPEADLAIQLVHAVFPEQLYTLLHYHSVLQYLPCIDEDLFVKILKENHVSLAAKKTLALTANIHEMVYGFVPDALANILQNLNVSNWNLLKPSGKWTFPYRFSMVTLTNVLLEKSLEIVTMKSLMLQSVKILFPPIAQHIVRHIAIRRTRSTY